MNRILLALVCAPVVTSAQELRYSISGAGAFFVPIGDLDGDGRNDLVTDRLVGLSGRDGSSLFSYGGGVEGLGRRDLALNLGDHDGDGRPELVLGNGLYSGASLLASPSVLPPALASFEAPAGNLGILGSIASLSDRNGDGIREVLTGWPDTQVLRCPSDHLLFLSGDSGGAIRIHSGLDGTVLHESISSEQGTYFGGLVAGVGDADGDGREEYAVATRGGSGPIFCEFSGRDVLRVYGGASDTVLWELDSAPTYMVGVGDVDRDGRADLALGYPLVERVEIRSVLDGRLLWARTNPEANALSFYGHTLVGAGNLFGDGHPTLIVTAPQPVAHPIGIPGDPLSSGPGHVWIESLGARRQFAHYRGRLPGNEYGSDVAFLGDVDGDGRPELAVGSSAEGVDGRVQVYTLDLSPRLLSGYPRRAP